MLTFSRLVGRNLAYHRRANVAVMLGVAVGAAVLTGSLLVGDSLRGSLRERVERQLNGVDAAAFFPRPVRTALADGLPGKAAPVLLLPGSVSVAAADDDPNAPSVAGVTVLGVDARFQPEGAPAGAVDWQGDGRTVVLSARVAEKLGVPPAATADAKPPFQVRVRVERASDLARSSALAKRASGDVTAGRLLTVAAVLHPESPANDFNLTPSPAAALNIYVPIASLSDLVRSDASRADTPLATAVLASGASADALTSALRSKLEAEDYGLRLRVPRRRGYVSVEAEQMVLPPAVVRGVLDTAKELGLRAEPTVVYIADTLAHGAAEVAYPVIAGLNPAAVEPLGPFGDSTLKDNEILLVNWDGSPLKGLAAGTPVSLSYFSPEVETEAKPKPRAVSLTVRGSIPLAGAAANPDLTPPVKGMTDERSNLRDWNRPPMLDQKTVQARVPDGGPRANFWTAHKATPMAYVNLATAERLFGSRFGAVTSVRVAPAAGETPDAAADRLRAALPRHLDPDAAGFRFEPVRERLLTASGGGTDFGVLFLGFSFFLIAAALLLVGLLFRLSLDRRAKEVGLLLAAGFAVRQVRRMLLLEGLALAVLGAAVGVAGGLLFNRLLLTLLTDLWPDPTVGTFLKPHATALSFVLGFGPTVLMALFAIYLSCRGLVKVAPPALLRGETAPADAATAGGSKYGRWVILVGVVAGVALIAAGGSVSNPDFQAMSFFGGGGLLLAAALAGLWVWMKRTRHGVVNGRGAAALGRLGARNAARFPTRSLLTASLLAAAAFLLVAVESFRRAPERDFLDPAGGSGGFNLVAESDVPVFQRFDAGDGRDDLEQGLQKAFGGTGTDPRFRAAKAEVDALAPGPDGTPNVYPLKLRAGDDASCLNLFQAGRPRLLGVPDALVTRGGFQFSDTEADTPEEKANPWLLLKKPTPSGAVPVVVERNTAMWMLKVAVGGEVTVPDGDGRDTKLRIVGTLVDSPFQSELLMADDAFRKLYPNDAGDRVFLLRAPAGREAAVAKALDIGLRTYGFRATPTRDKVAAYQAVVGAYLSTFQVLGGLGLLLGVCGLAVVILRGVWERLAELALLRAFGYRTRSLQALVLAENALLLMIGLGAGVVTALASVAPHVAGGAAVPWLRLAVLLGAALVVGLVVAAVATAGILRVPLVPALRRE